jgi:hypothetical protein
VASSLSALPRDLAELAADVDRARAVFDGHRPERVNGRQRVTAVSCSTRDSFSGLRT